MSDIRIPVDISRPAEEVLERASSVILSGGTVVYPSDTVYGILCRADDGEAAAGVRQLKGYGEERPFILIVSGMEMALRLTGELPPHAMEAAGRFWPGPVTLVLPASAGCPAWVASPGGTVALRQPDDPLSTGLLEKTGIPLVSTSANAAGQPEARSPDLIPEKILRGVDLVLDGGVLEVSGPSAVLRPTADGLEVIRAAPGSDLTFPHRE